MGDFKSGLYYLGKKRPDLELVPVYIDNLNRVMPKGEVLPIPLLSCISIGQPIWLESGEKQNRVPDPCSAGNYRPKRILKHILALSILDIRVNLWSVGQVALAQPG